MTGSSTSSRRWSDAAPAENPPLPALVVSLLVVAGRGRRRHPRLAPGRPARRARTAPQRGLVRHPGGPRRPLRRRDQRRPRGHPRRALVGGLLTVDRHGVDGVLTGGPVAVGAIAGQIRRVQNGFVRSYALSLLGGVLLVVLALLAVNLT